MNTDESKAPDDEDEVRLSEGTSTDEPWMLIDPDTTQGKITLGMTRTPSNEPWKMVDPDTINGKIILGMIKPCKPHRPHVSPLTRVQLKPAGS